MEIVSWRNEYPSFEREKILEWGCGASRTIRNIKKYVASQTELFACDINKEMIDWGTRSIEGVQYSVVDYLPPTNYEDATFTFIFGQSVFTHIDAASQIDWLREIHRILKKAGSLFLPHTVNTTSGNYYLSN